MTADQFREALSGLGLSQLGCAAFLAVDARTVRRWATGDVAVPRSVELLFGVMLRLGLKPEEV